MAPLEVADSVQGGAPDAPAVYTGCATRNR